jgi:hypothetical protein
MPKKDGKHEYSATSAVLLIRYFQVVISIVYLLLKQFSAGVHHCRKVRKFRQQRNRTLVRMVKLRTHKHNCSLRNTQARLVHTVHHRKQIDTVATS